MRLPSVSLLGLLAALVKGTASRKAEPDELPLYTKGRKILNQSGEEVRFGCVNWYGSQLEKASVGGLNVQRLDDIAKKIDELGFNCVRLPYSLDMVYDKIEVPDPEKTLAANPDLQTLRPSEIYGRVVAALTARRIMVFINNHNSRAMWCCSNTDGEGFWYTDEYPAAKWFKHVKLMAKKFAKNPYVAAFDLRNELREVDTPTWQAAPVWYEEGKPEISWALAAEKAGKIVLKFNKNMLVIIGGTDFHQYLDRVQDYPVHKQIGYDANTGTGKVVYQSHTYSWFATGQGRTYKQFEKDNDEAWGYLIKQDIAPVWLGEFGTADPTRAGFWPHVIRYIVENNVNWAYWAVDGQKEVDEDERFGILDMDYKTIRYPAKMDQLRQLLNGSPLQWRAPSANDTMEQNSLQGSHSIPVYNGKFLRSTL